MRITSYRSIAVTNGASTVVRAQETRIKSYHIINTHSAIVYIKFYDALTATAGTDTPVLNIAVPASGAMVSGTFNAEDGFPFKTGMCVSAVTGSADNDNTAPGALPIITLTYT